jgi:large subunit ribosomal protein L29
MALLKTKDIRGMRMEDLKLKFKEISNELMHERGVAAMGGAPASPGKIRALRTNVARIHTIMRELELAEANKKAEAKAPAKESKPKEKAAQKAAPRPKPKREKAEKRAAARKPAAKSEEETK